MSQSICTYSSSFNWSLQIGYSKAGHDQSRIIEIKGKIYKKTKKQSYFYFKNISLDFQNKGEM